MRPDMPRVREGDERARGLAVLPETDTVVLVAAGDPFLAAVDREAVSAFFPATL